MPHQPPAPLLLSSAMAVSFLTVRFHASAQAPHGMDQTTTSGTVLAADDFSDPSNGILPKSSAGTPQPDKIQRGYVNGEYQLAKTDPAYTFQAIAAAPGTFTDTTVDVDVRLVGPNSQGQYGLPIYQRRNLVLLGGRAYRSAVLPGASGRPRSPHKSTNSARFGRYSP